MSRRRDSTAPEDIVDRLARSAEAVIGIDYGERVIHWNKPAERLLGLSAKSAIGKPCYEVLGGRDLYGNRYCHRACPIANQARFFPDEPVRTFPLDVEDARGKTKRVILATFAAPSSRRSLATIVHVLAEPKRRPSMSQRNTLDPPPLAAIATDGPASAIDLSVRELEVLRCLAKGLPTGAIARRLGIRPVTVRNHVQSILRRLDVHSRLAAVLYANKHKLL